MSQNLALLQSSLMAQEQSLCNNFEGRLDVLTVSTPILKQTLLLWVLKLLNGPALRAHACWLQEHHDTHPARCPGLLLWVYGESIHLGFI